MCPCITIVGFVVVCFLIDLVLLGVQAPAPWAKHPRHPTAFILNPMPQLQALPKRIQTLARWSRGPLYWLAGLLLLGGVGVGGPALWRVMASHTTASKQPLTTTVEQRDLSVTLTANGTIKPARTINLSPKSSGYLKQLLVQEGDLVEQGQVIAYMDGSNLQGQLTQAQAQVEQAQANLDKLLNGSRSQEIAQAQAQLAEVQAQLQELEAGNRAEDVAQAQARLSQAQAQARQAEDDLERNQDLFEAGAISQQSLNQQRSTRDNAQAQVSEAQAALTLQQRGARPEDIAQVRSQVQQRQQALDLLRAGSRSEDIEAARAQLKSAQGGLQTIQTQINDTVIKAPFAGVVTKKYADPGSFVTPTTAGSSTEGAASNSILTLAATNQVVAYLDESNIAQIKLGQAVQVTAEAYPDRNFSGTVSQIAAQASTVQNVTSFEVKISLEPAAQALLKAGMGVEANFQVRQINQALVIPSAAVVRQASGTGVYVLGPKQQPHFQPVEIGTTVGELTEVKSGLAANQQVLISFPPGQEPKSDIRSPFSGPGRSSGSQTGNPTSGGQNAPSQNSGNAASPTPPAGGAPPAP